MRIRIGEQSPGDVPPDIPPYKIYSPLTRLSIDRGHEIFIAAALYKILKVNTVTAVCVSAATTFSPFLFFLQFALVVDPAPSVRLSVRKRGQLTTKGRRKRRNEREEKREKKRGRITMRVFQQIKAIRDRDTTTIDTRNDEMEIVSRGLPTFE